MQRIPRNVPVAVRPTRSGVSRTELLVLLLIGGLLVALVVPGVGAAREAARQTQCRNNLHMLGLALHNYHDAWALFPPGWYPPHPDDPTGAGSWGWGVLLMPYLD